MANFDALRCVLDRKSRPTTIFFRDDDAGWANDRFMALGELFCSRDLPLDIAVIPGGLGAGCIEQITRLRLCSPELFHIHQHGHTHSNHEARGRKSEFGLSRSRADQLTDIQRGRARLLDTFGDWVEPIFTPPWNRCTQETADALNESGFSVLSRDLGAIQLDLGSLVEMSIGFDWVKKRNTEKAGGAELATDLASRAAKADIIGIMLHHEHLNDSELDIFDDLLSILQTTGHVEFSSMMELAIPDYA
jgi:hypothetical protein